MNIKSLVIGFLLSLIVSVGYMYQADSDYKTYKYAVKKKQILTKQNQDTALAEKEFINNSNNTRECYDNWISDGYGDDGNNNEECLWDGGDCCGSTCISDTYDCDEDADWAACNSECLDPNANDDCCYDNSCPFTCEGQGLVDCWDGSCAENESDCPEMTCADTELSLIHI